MVSIRPAESRDVNEAARVAHDAYQHYTERIGRPPAPMQTDYAATVHDGTMWVAERDDKLIGFIVLHDGTDHLHLNNLAVDPAAQGQGVGARLLALAEAEAGRRGFDRIQLYTNEAMHENLDYYPRKGYIETHRGEQDGYRRVFFTKKLRSRPTREARSAAADPASRELCAVEDFHNDDRSCDECLRPPWSPRIADTERVREPGSAWPADELQPVAQRGCAHVRWATAAHGGF